LQAVVDCVGKLYLCHEADPHVWEDIRMSGFALLKRRELERYRDLIPGDEDLQDEWEAAVDDPEKYVSLLIVQIMNSGRNLMKRTITIRLRQNKQRRIFSLRIMR
jgi:hypothetical protein